MTGFDPYTWYTLTNHQQINDTLTAASNTQAAFDPNSPSNVYYEGTTQPVADVQLWQLYPIKPAGASASSSTTAYIFRNRAIGPNAYLTTAWSTRKCGGGACATVPVMTLKLNEQSLWNFGAWGFSDPTGGAFIYNYGNGSDWRLDTTLDGGPQSELLDYKDTNRMGSHWEVSSHATFATDEPTGFRLEPTAAGALLAQFTGSANDAGVTDFTDVVSATNGGAVATGTGARDPGSSSSSSPSSSSGGGLSIGAAIGMGVGLGLFLALIVVAFFVIRWRRKRRRAAAIAQDGDSLDELDTRIYEWNQVNNAYDYGSRPPNSKYATYAEMDSPQVQRHFYTNEMPQSPDRERSEVVGSLLHSSRAELTGSAPLLPPDPVHATASNPGSWSTSTYTSRGQPGPAKSTAHGSWSTSTYTSRSQPAPKP